MSMRPVDSSYFAGMDATSVIRENEHVRGSTHGDGGERADAHIDRVGVIAGGALVSDRDGNRLAVGSVLQ